MGEWADLPEVAGVLGVGGPPLYHLGGNEGPEKEGCPRALRKQQTSDLLFWLLVWGSGSETRVGQPEFCLQVLPLEEQGV